MRKVFSGGIDTRLGVGVLRVAVVIAIVATQIIGHGFVEENATQAQPVALLPAAIQPILDAGQARPTAAWLKFCGTHPSECSIDTAEAATITLTPEAWQNILAVNKKVNATVKARMDQDHWGVEDRWDYPDDGVGDCEDIQLLKRRHLMRDGLPHRAMRMTVVIDEEGLGHAVMMVRTDRGDFILDNKRNAVLPWSKTGYVYVKREGSDGQGWAWLKEQTAPIQVTTAIR